MKKEIKIKPFSLQQCFGSQRYSSSLACECIKTRRGIMCEHFSSVIDFKKLISQRVTDAFCGVIRKMHMKAPKAQWNKVNTACSLEIIKNAEENYFQLRLSNHRKMLIKKLCTSLHDQRVCNTRAFTRERENVTKVCASLKDLLNLSV